MVVQQEMQRNNRVAEEVLICLNQETRPSFTATPCQKVPKKDPKEQIEEKKKLYSVTAGLLWGMLSRGGLHGKSVA